MHWILAAAVIFAYVATGAVACIGLFVGDENRVILVFVVVACVLLLATTVPQVAVELINALS